jgi:hypothetical protein
MMSRKQKRRLLCRRFRFRLIGSSVCNGCSSHNDAAIDEKLLTTILSKFTI